MTRRVRDTGQFRKDGTCAECGHDAFNARGFCLACGSERTTLGELPPAPEHPPLGTVCILRGGHILRFHGLWAGIGPVLCFRAPSVRLEEPIHGYAAGWDEVIRVLTAGDLPMLQTRLEELLARDLKREAVEVRLVISELTGTQPAKK